MELIIFIGLQASGKSSFFRSRFAQSHAYVSKDQFRNNKNRDRRQLELVTAALEEGRSVVIDNTNPTVADRQPLIALGRCYGAKVIGYYFESRIDDCLARNRSREGASRVADVAIYSTIKRMERPSRAEGFDELFFVRMADGSGFAVSNWIEERRDDDG